MIKRFIASLFFSILVIHFCSAQLSISEVMFSNGSIDLDGSGAFPDWVELHNSSASSLSLSSFRLSDKEDNEYYESFQVPDILLAPDEYIVIILDGETTWDGTYYHLPFKLDSDNEGIFLFDEAFTLIDKVDAAAHSHNVSYGKLNGEENFKFLVATPGEGNTVNDALVFSHSPGFHTESIELSVSSINPISEIRYTHNGETPTIDSPIYLSQTLSSLENTPNILSNIPTTQSASFEAPDSPVFKIHTLKFATFQNEIRTSPIATKSYLIAPNISSRYPYPIISLVTDSMNFFDYEEGIYVAGSSFISGNPIWTGNYFNDGIEWERDVHVEFFEPDGNLAFSQEAGVRIHGGKTRGSRVKSLKFYARKDYGLKQFYHSILNLESERYKRFILRNYHTCWNGSVLKDALTHEICDDFDFEMQHARQAILFLNGEYWGMYDIREALDHHHLAEIANTESQEVNILTSTSGLFENNPSSGIIQGTNSEFVSHIEAIEFLDLSNSENYSVAESFFDISSFVDYYIAETFFNNKDWIKNNHKIWKPTEQGKWRWLFFDIDAGWGNQPVNEDMIAQSSSPIETTSVNPPESTLLFRKLLENESFKTRFVKRAACLLENELNADSLLLKIEDVRSRYNAGMAEHVDRWNRPTSVNAWNSSIDNYLVNFASSRGIHYKNQLQQNFGLEVDIIDDPCAQEDDKNPDLITESTQGVFKVWPNPTNGVLFFKSEAQLATSLEIFDITGKKVGRFVLQGNSLKKLKLESSLPSGVYAYFVKDSSNHILQRSKFILTQ